MKALLQGLRVIKVLLLVVMLPPIILSPHSEPAIPKEDNLVYISPVVQEEAPMCRGCNGSGLVILDSEPIDPAVDNLAYIGSIIFEEVPMWQDCNTPEYIPTQGEIDALARFLYGEARNCSIEGQAAAVWCVLNRVDSDDPYFPDTIIDVVTQPNQFFGYNKHHPVIPELAGIAEDVLLRYSAERSGIEDVGRVLPREYLYFSGDGYQNYFTVTYGTTDVWDWSSYNPYSE